MALTGRERGLVFEILDFPPGAPVVEMWGEFGRSQAVQQNTFRSATDAIDGRILALDVDGETRVREFLAEWVKIATDERRIEEAEDVSGVVSDSKEKRRLIRKRLQVYIPVYLEDEIKARHTVTARGYGGNMSLRG